MTQAIRRHEPRFIFWLILALFIVGCGGGSREESVAEQPVDRDSLSLLADEVDDAFLATITETSPDAETRAIAFSTAKRLVEEVLNRERPKTGWDIEALESALRERRLVVEIKRVGTLESPWLLRIPDPIRQATVGEMFLMYPDEGLLISLSPEPFEHDYQTAAWKDTGGTKTAVAGWSRTRTGLQPTAWIFELPDEVKERAQNPDPLRILQRKPLSFGGANSLKFVGGTETIPPRIKVVNAALPNSLFDECANCPHLRANLTFRFARDGYVLQLTTQRRSPYAAFVLFIEALIKQDEYIAYQFAADPVVIEIAKDYAFDRSPSRGKWRIVPGSTGDGLDQTFFRGDEGAYRILMSVRDSSFVVTSIAPTEFIID